MKNRLALLLIVSTASMQALDLPEVPKCADVRAYVKDHKQHAALAVVAALLTQPAFRLVVQCLKGEGSAYGMGSLLGLKCGTKTSTAKPNPHFRMQGSVGSLDVKVSVPTQKAVKRQVRSLKKVRSVSDMANWLYNFCPKLVVALEDKTSPLIRQKHAGVEHKTKRLYAQFSLGDYSWRAGVDLSEALLAPVAMVAVYLLSKMTNKAVVDSGASAEPDASSDSGADSSDGAAA